MAQYGGEKYMKQEGHQTNEHAHNQLHSTTAGDDIGGTGTNVHSTITGQNIGGTGHGHEEVKHGGTGGGILHRSGSGSSSSSESDGEGGRRKKKGVVEKIKEKLPGDDHGGKQHAIPASATVGGGEYGNVGEEGHEKKGLMDKIKDKLPGGGHQ
ncbi:dehydrin Xero 1-like protein [Tanacetum coccineum]